MQSSTLVVRPPDHRRSRTIVILLAALAAVVAGALGGSAWIDTRGPSSFHTGKLVVLHLETLAGAVKAHDRAAIGAAFSADAEGDDLGLTRRTLVESRGRVRRYQWQATSSGEGTGEAGEALVSY